MKTFRTLLISSLLLGHASAVDVIKTWSGASNNALNNVSNWDNNQRPTFGAAANTDALLFTGAGTGAVGVNVDATAKSITISGILPYTFSGSLPLRLGDSSNGTVQPNTGAFINNSEATVSITTSGGLFFRFGSLEAVGAPITVGANAFIDIGNGSADAGRNLTISGNHTVTVQSILTGLGGAATAGGHFYKQGDNQLVLNGTSTAWNGQLFVEAGAVAATRAGSLGSTEGATYLAGGESAGRVEVSGNITIAETFRLAGRSLPNLVSLVNLSGNNILSGPLFLDAGGEEYAISALGGDLDITGPVAYGTADQPATLRLAGNANGIFWGSLGGAGNPLSLVKEDTGKWSIAGPSSFTGSISVAAGELEISTAHTGGGQLQQAAASTLALRVAQPGQTLVTSGLDIVGGEGTSLVFDLGVHGIPSAPVLTAGALALQSEVAIRLKAASLEVGQIPLIDYEGVIGGEGFDSLSLVGLPPRLSAALINDEVNTRILLQISGFDLPRWSGVAGPDWDADDGTGTGTFNWREVISGQPTRYLQGEGGTDSVLFDDTATGPTAINLTAELTPLAVTVNNTSLNYEFIGPGFLGGTATLTKQGTGTLRIANEVANTFTELTDIQAGVVEIGDGVTDGRGTLGTGPIQNQGSLVLNRPDAITLAGAISGTGSVIKRGDGIATLSGNSDFTGPVLIEHGTIRLGTGGALGAIVGTVSVASGATLDFRGQLLPPGKVVSISGTGVGGAGAVINTTAGGPAVGLKNLVFTGPTIIGGSARWDIRDSPGGVQVNGHDLIKGGTNSVFWAQLGETGIGNLRITGNGSRLAFEGDTTLGAAPGLITVEGGASLGFQDSTAVHTKPIRVEGGTINFSGGIANTVASTVTIVTEATISTAANVEAVVSGKITGIGGLTKTTGGILKVTHDANDYTGATTINAGTLWIGNDGPTGSLPAGDIFNNGTLIVRRWGELVLPQTISGSGAFQVANVTYPVPQEVTLSGNNTFTGGVTLARGTLRITNSNALGAGQKLITIQGGRPTLILDGSAGDLNLSSDFIFRISSDGPQGGIQNVAGNNVINSNILLFNQNGGHTRLRGDGGSLTLNGNLRIIPLADHATTTGNRQLLLDGDIGGVINGAIQGPELPEDTRLLLLFKQGAGTWVLNGVNTHTGASTINSGRLKLGAAGSLAATPSLTLFPGAVLDLTEQPNFTLASGQTLTGSGGIDGDLAVGAGSIVTPGAALTAGSFSISGNFELAGGRLNISLGSATESGNNDFDSFEVGGDLKITEASTIDLATNGSAPLPSYTLAEFEGEFIGDLNQISFINPTRLTPVLDVESEPGKLLLLLVGTPGNLVWSGAESSVWSGVSNNWNLGPDAVSFLSVDQVRFDDTAPADKRSVSVSSVLRPSSITVDTETGFTLSFAAPVGTNQITGTASLTKLGGGLLTLTGTGAFNGSGKTSIQGGGIVLAGNAGGFIQTRWIELHPSTVLNTSALVNGLNLGNLTDERVLSGSGTVIGTVLIGGAAVVKPGLSSNPNDQSTAGDQIGVLTLNGSLALVGGAAESVPRAVLQIAGPTGQVADPFDATGIAAFSTTPSALHDQIIVNGILALDAGSTLRLELAGGYTPQLGDVFNLFDWTLLNLNANADELVFDPLAAGSFDLPELPAGWYWNRSQFLEHGIVFISLAPALVGDIVFTQGAIVNPGVQVTLSAPVSGLDPYTYQWLFQGQPIALEDNATAQSAQLVLTAAEVLEGDYQLAVGNPIGVGYSPVATLRVNDPVQITGDPQSLTLDPGQPANFSVQATGTDPFTYQWRRNGAALEGQTAASFEIAAVTENDEGEYDVVISNVVGSVTSEVANLNVKDPVVVLNSPTPLGVFQGATANFSAQFVGTGPFEFRWLKNGVDLPGTAAAQQVLVLSNVTVADEGDYSVRISNSVNSVTSAAAALRVATDLPKIVSLSSPQLVAAGQPLTFTVQAIGQPPVSYQWFKNGKAIGGATGASLNLSSAKLTDAGRYQVRITGPGGAIITDNIEAAMVDAVARTLNLQVGTAAKLEAKASGAGLSLAWQKDGTPVVDSDRIKGADKNVLQIGKSLEDGDSALYQLVVTSPGTSPLTTAGHRLNVFSEAPIITEDPPEFPDAIVSGNFLYQIPVDPDSKKAPTSFAAKGLPPGLRLNRTTGEITGKPTAVSPDPLGYLVTLTASNRTGSAEVEGHLLVEDFNANLAGAYAAPLERHAALNADLGGRLEMKVTPRGAVSGRLFLGTFNLPLRAQLNSLPGQAIAELEVTLARRGTTPLTLRLHFDGIERLVAPSEIVADEESLAFTGWRNVWDRHNNPATTPRAAYHTLAFEIPNHEGSADVPQGNGYAAIILAPAGTVRVAGRLADGENLAATGILGPLGEVALYRPLYRTAVKGSVAGQFSLGVETAGGALTWTRPPNPGPRHTLYRHGFPGVVDLLPVGGPYTPPTNGQVFLNLLPGQDNARLTFAAGGIEAAVADPDHLDLPVSIALRSRATVTTDATHNPRRVTLKLTERTGLISGVGHLEDDNSGRPVKRQYHFNGLSVPTTEGLRNHGYFLLNGLVADEDSLSGQVVLQPAF